MTILILDTGVDLSHPAFSKMNNIVQGRISKDLATKKFVCEYGKAGKDYNGHGTAITYLIAKNRPQDRIISLQIGTEDAKADDIYMLEILKFVEINIVCDIINLSVCVLNARYIDEMTQICRRLYKKGIYMVSSFDNDGRMSFPASIPYVIGVDITPNSYSAKDYFWIENSVVNVRCGIGKQRLPWLNSTMKSLEGSSITQS